MRIFRLGRSTAGVTSNRSALPKQREVYFREGHARGKRRTHQEEPGSLRSAFRGETRRGFFGFAQNVGDLVFAADVGVAFEFSGAGGGEEHRSASRDLRADIAQTGDDVSMESRAGARNQFKAFSAGLREIEPL